MYNVHPFSLSPVLPFVDRMVIMNHIFKNSYFWIKIQYTSSVSVLSHPALFLFVRSPLRRAEPRALFQIRCIFSMPSVARPAAPPCMACLAPPPPCDFSPLALNLWPYPQPERRTDWNASKAKNGTEQYFIVSLVSTQSGMDRPSIRIQDMRIEQVCPVFGMAVIIPIWLTFVLLLSTPVLRCFL